MPFDIIDSCVLQCCQQKDVVRQLHVLNSFRTQHIEPKLHGHMQVLYGLRTMYNVRNGQDLAQFLADPQRDEFESHSSHLTRIQVQHASC
jgi:hypothetical protein